MKRLRLASGEKLLADCWLCGVERDLAIASEKAARARATALHGRPQDAFGEAATASAFLDHALKRIVEAAAALGYYVGQDTKPARRKRNQDRAPT